MKLNAKEFKRFKELLAKVKAGKASSAEEAELNELTAKKNEKGSNDIKWWANYPVLLKDTTNIAFNYLQGTSFDILDNFNVNRVVKFGSVAVARYMPTIGISRSSGDAFNAQMRQLWLDMHRKYRGIGTYQASDLGMVILAITSLFATISKFERIYGLLNTFKVMNRTIPYGWLEALNVDASTITPELADFRYNLNFRIAKLQQLCLPKGIALIESEFINCGCIFKDSENSRAATFMFDPVSFGIYDSNSLSTGGCVKYQRFAFRMTGTTPNGLPAHTFNDVFNILDDQINALLNDDDVAKICSDLVAAYGPENVATLVPIPELYVVEPVHDYERLVQFHNLTIVGHVYSAYEKPNVVSASTAESFRGLGFDTVVYQDNDVIYNMLTVCGQDDPHYYLHSGRVLCMDDGSQASDPGMVGPADAIIFNTWVEQPGEVEVMCGTRFTSIVGQELPDGNGHNYSYLEAFGTNVVTEVTVFNRVSTGGIRGNTIYGSYTQHGNMNGLYSLLAQFSQFDWHPRFYITSNSGEVFQFGDIDNCACIKRETLERIHEVALYSGYHIPVVPLIK